MTSESLVPPNTLPSVPENNEYMKVFLEIAAELDRAKRLHGPTKFHGPHEGFAVLYEEVDELWDEVKKNPRKIPGGRSAHKEAMRKEAVQIAAMAIRFAAELTVREKL